MAIENGGQSDGGAAASGEHPEPLKELEAVYEQLSQEEQQDERVSESQELLLDDVSAEKLRYRETEYTDIEKHFVRSKAWLKVAKELAPEVKQRCDRGLRYLTLPGFNRLDVGLLLREGLLAIDPDDPKGVYVAAFEADPNKFGRIAGRTPRFKLLANCSVESAVTDKQNLYYSELEALFPFDVINLDLTTSLTPRHEGPYSTTMQAINTVLRRQAGYSMKWALFLTFRNLHSDWEPVALGQLFDNLQENIAAYPTVRDMFYERHREHTVSNLAKKNIEASISQAVVKWLLDRAHSYNIRLEDYRCFQYQRYPEGLPKYTICKQVLVFSGGQVSVAEVPMKNTPREAWMEGDLVKCIDRHKPLDVEQRIWEISVAHPEIFDELESDIAQLCNMGEV